MFEKKEEKPKEPLSVETLKTEMDGKLDAIMGKLGELTTKTVTPAEKAELEEAAPDKNRVQVPPAWIDLVDKILGPDFVCEYSLPDTGAQKFTIIVPPDKTNADPEYLKFYTTDRRTVELGNTGARGVKEWCLKVRGHLQRSEVKLPQYP